MYKTIIIVLFIKHLKRLQIAITNLPTTFSLSKQNVQIELLLNTKIILFCNE